MSPQRDDQPTGSAPLRSRFPKIGDLLVERRLITAEQLAEALAFQKEHRPNKLLGQVLVELRLVPAEELVATLADASGIPFVRVNPAMVDAVAFQAVPQRFLEKHCVIPLSIADTRLTIALEDFTNIFLIEDIERLSGREVALVAATRTNIIEVLASFATDGGEFVFDEIIDQMKGDDLTVVERHSEEPEDLENAASDSPVIKLVNHMIHGAVLERASDIHVEPDDGTFRIRYRIDGDLHEKLRPPFALLPAVVSRVKIMAGMDIAERRIPQDGGITVILERRPIDLRVSTMPTKFGEKVVIRVIDNKGGTLDLESLGFLPGMLARMRDVVSEKNGVVLVTGPTGSGKSTTLYAALAEIVNTRLNVSTVEDPIEFNLHGVNQFQVNERAGFTFAKALRSLLRQDPDVIMVGEVRDSDTAQIAVQAALTGHLVFSTLHTNDAPSAVTRLFNMGVEPYLVAASLRGVLAQRLVRRLCAHCTEESAPAPLTRRTLHRIFGETLPVDRFFKGKGCGRCRDTGYSGRVGIYELLVPNEEVLEAISQHATLQHLRRLAAAGDYTTLREDGIAKVQSGTINVESLLEVVSRKADREEPATPGAAETWFEQTRGNDATGTEAA